MTKQITIGNEQVALVSDDGRLWFSSLEDVLAYRARRGMELLRLKAELQNWFSDDSKYQFEGL